MKVIVTGCNGFVGGTFGRLAARLGYEILGLGRTSSSSPDWPGFYEQADLQTSDLAEIIREFAPDILFHAAGTASVAASLTAPVDDLRDSMLTWVNTLDGVRRSGCKTRILFPSSAAVYGDVGEFPIREDSPIRPISPYGFHKAGCELLAREYVTCFRLDITVCRIFSLVGPLQRRLLAWELYNQFVGNAEQVWIEGLGTETRDYLHVEDSCAAMLHLAASRTRETSKGQLLSVNIASGQEISVAELARQIGRLTESSKDIQCRGIKRFGDPLAWRVDVSLLNSLIANWRPRPLSQSLLECIAVWQQKV